MKLIDVIEETMCRKNKLLIDAIEPVLNSLRMGGETEARPIPRTGSFRYPDAFPGYLNKRATAKD